MAVPISSTENDAEVVSAKQVEDHELECINIYRSKNGRPTSNGSDLIGLALSGGGVRAATFHLGVLEALATAEVMENIDCISTVSGGGYVAGWLGKWIYHKSFKSVLSGLKQRHAGGEEPPQLNWLRQNSTYLTPRLGLFGYDTGLLVATYLHNLAINLILLILVCIVAILAPRLVLTTLQWLGEANVLSTGALPLALVGGTLTALTVFLLSYQLLQHQGGYGPLELHGVPDQYTVPNPIADDVNNVPSSSAEPICNSQHSAVGGETVAKSIGDSPELQDTGTLDNIRTKGWKRDAGFMCVLGIGLLYAHLHLNTDRSLDADNQLFFLLSVSYLLVSVIFVRHILQGHHRLQTRWYGLSLMTVLVILTVVVALLQLSGFFPYWCECLMFGLGLARALDATSSTRSDLWRRRAIVANAFAGALCIWAWCYFAATNSIRHRHLYRFLSRVFTDQSPEWKILIVLVSFAGAATLASIMTSQIRIVTAMRWLKRIPLISVLFGKQWDLTKRMFAIAAMAVFIVYLGYRVPLITGMMHEAKMGDPTAFLPIMIVWASIAIVISTLSFNILVAISGRVISAYKRERISALSAQMYLYCFSWFYLSTLSIYGPLLLSPEHVWSLRMMGGVWLASLALCIGILGPLRGMESAAPAMSLLTRGAPYVFLTGVLLALAGFVTKIVFHTDVGTSAEYMKSVYSSLSGSLFPLVAITLVITFMLSARFGINMFSMHGFYQARLAWAYLAEHIPGATADAMSCPRLWDAKRPTLLHKLCPVEGSGYDGPYMLWNAAINLADSDELAWQERKSASFLLSPLYCGFDVRTPLFSRRTESPELYRYAYARTEAFAYGGEQLRLAQAMAISGSALGSNMGQLTSPRIRFIHTLFNLRLGWWLSNPRYPGMWPASVPRARVSMMLAELLGKTNDREPYVNLSDGGHFENLGLYELVRRRYRLILVCDGSDNKDGQFSSLGRAIERCRTDFGAEIVINIEGLRTKERTRAAACNWAVGSVKYPSGGAVTQGVLIYMKAVVTGGEPCDVWSFALREKDFPNHSITNQWFTESLFASYRELGRYVGASMGEALNVDDMKGKSLIDKAENLLASANILREGTGSANGHVGR